MGGYVASAIGRELGALSNGSYVTLASRIHIIRWRTIMGCVIEGNRQAEIPQKKKCRTHGLLANVSSFVGYS